MQVRELMRAEPRSCGPDDTLASAGGLMAEVGCGFLPVISERGDVIGVITDRDICCGLTTRDALPSKVHVRDVMSQEVFSSFEEDDLSNALHTMRTGRVRRLPVVDSDWNLRGVLSLDDVVLAARSEEDKTYSGPKYEDVARTLQSINEHPALAIF
jgi:CBS domain-containing protein